MSLSFKRPMPAVGASFPQPFLPKVGDPCHRRGVGGLLPTVLHSGWENFTHSQVSSVRDPFPQAPVCLGWKKFSHSPLCPG